MKYSKNAGMILALTAMAATESVGISPAFATQSPAMTSISVTLHSPKTTDLSGVGFATPKIGWLVGKGTILYTNDGGHHFSSQYQGSVNLQNIQVQNGNDVVAWGYHHILFTTNGGLTWKAVTVPNIKPGGTRQIMNLHFASPDVGTVLVGQMQNGTRLYRTTDGGRHWTSLSIPTHTVSVAFADRQNGWLITSSSNNSSGGFYRTTDGGQRWVKTQGETESLWYINGANVYPTGPHSAYAQILGQAGMTQSSSSLFRTTDGSTWKPVLGTSTAGGGPAPGVGQQRVAVGPGIDAGSIAVVGQNDLRVIGGVRATGIGTAQMARSDNGGLTWKTFATIPGANGYLVAGSTLSFVNSNEGWLLEPGGHQETLLHTVNGGLTWREEFPRSTMWPVMGVSFISRNIGFGLGIVGDVNKVLKTTDGGQTWLPTRDLPVERDISYVGPFSGQAIDFVSDRVGTAIGGNGHLYVTQNSGKTWNRVATPRADGRVYSVYLANGGRTIVIDAQNGVHASTDGGAKWRLFEAGDAASGGSAWSLAINRAVGGKLYSGLTKLGKNTWASFAGIRGQIEWMSGNNGEGFLKSSDGGQQWTSYDFPTNLVIMMGNMGFTDDKNGWLWTLAGRLFVTHDGGTTWTQVGA